MKEKQIVRISIMTVGAICITILLYGIFISPTFIKYEKLQTQQGEVLIKINRLTGDVMTFNDGIWYSNKDKVDLKIESIKDSIGRVEDVIKACENINSDPALYDDMREAYNKSSFNRYIKENLHIQHQLGEVNRGVPKPNNPLLEKLPFGSYRILLEARTSDKSLNKALIDVITACEEAISKYEDDIKKIKKYN